MRESTSELRGCGHGDNIASMAWGARNLISTPIPTFTYWSGHAWPSISRLNSLRMFLSTAPMPLPMVAGDGGASYGCVAWRAAARAAGLPQAEGSPE